jgi:urease accessory protein
MRSLSKSACAAAALAGGLMIGPAALAHPGHPGHETLNLVAGALHPFTGLDHMLAMVAVGLWAALRGGRAIWAWPAAFLAAFLAGYGLGQGGLAIPLAEPAILASVMVLGALTAADARVPTALGVAIIGLCGAAHGYAHGSEAPLATLGFPAGMMASTALLHLMGLAAAFGLKHARWTWAIRLLGAATLAGGLALAVTG